MEKRIIPWIKKKLIEIIGEDEPTLVEFVSTRLKHKTKPEYILQEIKIALGKFFYLQLWVPYLYGPWAKIGGTVPDESWETESARPFAAFPRIFQNNLLGQKVRRECSHRTLTIGVQNGRNLLPYLDEEADMFVVKLWRLLIYETEAREEGINQ